MEFKKLDIQESRTWSDRLKSKQTIRTIISILLGAIVGFLYIYFSSESALNELPGEEIFQSVLFGAFIGFFITNSPCARNRC